MAEPCWPPSLATAQSNNEVLAAVLCDGAGPFDVGDPTALSGAVPEPHTPGYDGGPYNLVVRNNDTVAAGIDWNVNDDEGTGVMLQVELSARRDGDPDSTGMFAGCDPNSSLFPNPRTLLCHLGDQAEGSGGVIRPTATINGLLDDTTFDMPGQSKVNSSTGDSNPSNPNNPSTGPLIDEDSTPDGVDGEPSSGLADEDDHDGTAVPIYDLELIRLLAIRVSTWRGHRGTQPSTSRFQPGPDRCVPRRRDRIPAQRVNPRYNRRRLTVRAGSSRCPTVDSTGILPGHESGHRQPASVRHFLKTQHVLKDTVIGGVSLPAGSMTTIWFAAANRDIAVNGGQEQSDPNTSTPPAHRASTWVLAGASMFCSLPSLWAVIRVVRWTVIRFLVQWCMQQSRSSILSSKLTDVQHGEPADQHLIERAALGEPGEFIHDSLLRAVNHVSV